VVAPRIDGPGVDHAGLSSPTSALVTPGVDGPGVDSAESTPPLAPPPDSDFSGSIDLTLPEAKVEFESIEPGNPWVDTVGSKLGR